MSADANSEDSPLLGRARWYVNRLRCMSPAELPHRVARAVGNRLEARGLRRDARPEPVLDREGACFVDPCPALDPAPYRAAADNILDGYLDVFAMHRVAVGHPPDWNRDPKTGITAPLEYGKTLNYRDPALVGDIKYLWEPNRHLHLVTLAQAWRLTGERRYLDGLGEQLASWLRDCPTGYGPNWTSALEPAMRLINWSLAWQIIGGSDSELFEGADGKALRADWLRSVYDHARFVRGFYSRHSSANNHLIGEATGVYVAGATWPYWPELARWREHAAGILEVEIQRQNGPDGVNREQAFAYQQFELDLLLLNWLAGIASGKPLSEAYADCMQRMLGFLAAVMDVGGNVPMVGDSDDGYVVRLSQETDFCPYRSLLATGALLFKRADFRAKAGWLDAKTRWLFGDKAAIAWEKLEGPRPPLPREFPTGGYYILGCDFDTPREIRMLVDAGPLGYREIAAHGHADALAVTLSIAGREFLIDPGTYAYHADDTWRQYFRGTAAHNTVRIDGRCQSEPGGNFMWLTKARASCLRWQSNEQSDLFEGVHDGYERLADPVTHRRVLRLDKEARRITMEDHLQMAGEHDVELLLHCDERCKVEQCEDGYRLIRGDQQLRIRLPEGGESRIYRGSESPIMGWVSRRFDERHPCPTIAWRATLRGNAALTTELEC